MDSSKIQWTRHTWNPWHGCKKVSPGCKYCYMYRDMERYGKKPTDVLRSKTMFFKPYKWKERALVFSCSWSDFFIEEADEWRPEAWEVIKNTPHLQYQILTKRPERIRQCLPKDWGEGYPNVWLGVSGENEELTFNRLSILINIPAVVRFISAEPLLEDVVSTRNEALISKLDWVIIGGESGNDTGKYLFRPTKLVWIERLIDICSRNKVPCFNKQLGTHLSKVLKLKDRHGGNLTEWPNKLRVRQFPLYKALHEKRISKQN